MNHIPMIEANHPLIVQRLIQGVVLWIAAILPVSLMQAAEFDGFTEPFREIDIASPEPGIIVKINVQEGDTVQAGQVLSNLDNDVHTALLAIAEQNKQASGRMDALQAELALRLDRVKKFEKLLKAGHARQEEIDKARMELEIATAQVKVAREELLVKELEYRKIKVQLDRRTIISPINGVVTTLHKDVGEFVAPNAPEIMTVVQLDPLLATFSISGPAAATLKVHQTMKVRFPISKRTVEGQISFISPVTDAESGMVRVKIRIPNRDGKSRSGERCLIELKN